MVDTKGKIDVGHAQAAKPYKAPEPDPVKAAPAAAKVDPEVAKTKAEAKKKEHAAIEKVATINQRLGKEGSGNRVDVQMRAGEPHYQWGNFVPTRELTEDELDAVETLK